MFKAQHVTGFKGLALVAGPGLVVYTFTGDIFTNGTAAAEIPIAPTTIG